MINPLDLLKRNIKVFKAYQQPREFICTFFKAYHCGFSEAFNVGEAVNFVLPESLAYIK
jgi:histone demethylase JARID1